MGRLVPFRLDGDERQTGERGEVAEDVCDVAVDEYEMLEGVELRELR